MLDAFLASLPAYARDVQRTLGACLADEALKPAQTWGCLIAGAQTLAFAPLTRAIEAECPLDPQTQEAAKGAAAVMAMNTIYFRAVHLMENEDYRHRRAGIRMNALAPAGAAKSDVDLWCLVVAALNACGGCLDDHEKSLRDAGGAAEQAQAAFKLAAALAGAVAVLRAEAAR
jgi:alkyl hydroperoxide reductase subunit D